MNNKKIIGILLVVALFIGAIAIGNMNRLPLNNNKNPQVEKAYGVSILVVHEDDKGLPLYQHLSQSTVVGIHVEKKSSVDISDTDLHKYDAIYMHQSVRDEGTIKNIKNQITDYVANGGKLFLDAALVNDFSEKLSGVTKGEKVDINTIPFTYPEVGTDFEGIQKVASAFEKDYKEYIKEELLVDTIKPTTGKPIVGFDGGAIVTINNYKNGQVVVLTDFLPNYSKYITAFDLNYRNEEKNYFQFFYATGNTQMLNELAAYVAKDNHGLALKRVMGTYGRPLVAIQNHYEVLSSIKNKELMTWVDILKEYDQVPSISLIRGSYEWGEWYGTMNYHINTGDSTNPVFIGEEEESYYSTGFHIKDINNEYITFGKYPEYTSYYSPVANNFRPYPYFIDWDNNGTRDIIVGSHDGKIYFVKNIGTNEEPKYNKITEFLYDDGTPIVMGENIAPTVLDYNGDGLLDLIVGDKEGNIHLLMNSGKNFKKPVPLTTKAGDVIKVTAEAAPFAGDFDGDNILDLVVGDVEGYVYFYQGVDGGFSTGEQLTVNNEPIKVDRFAAPHMGDYNSDNSMDLLVGDGSGDIHLYVMENNQLSYKGPIESERKNIYGKNTIYTGKNVVPFLVDYNGDGKQDLVTAQIEFGLAYDTSAEDFPYKKELVELLEYAKDNYVSIMPHIYFHAHKDDALEKREIELHMKNFEKLGLPWGYIGTNQHTWRVNIDNPTQSFKNLMEYNIWNNFAFKAPNANSDPYIAKDYIWPTPFMMMEEDQNLPMVLFTPSPYLGYYNKVYDHLVDMDLPLTFFEHIEYKITRGGDEIQILYKIINKIEEIRKNNNYSFVTEDQMARAFINSMLTEYKVEINNKEVIITPDTSNVPQHLAEDYIGTGGLKVELGEKFADKKVDTDSLIQYKQGNDLYIGVNKEIKLNIADESTEDYSKINIISANTPIDYKESEAQLTIDLKGVGMKEVRLESLEPLNIEGDNLKVKQDGNIYVVVHYGDNTQIIVKRNMK